jgi:hypothetical protein
MELALLVIVGILVVCLLIPVTITIIYIRKQGDDQLTIITGLFWNTVKFKYSIPVIRISRDKTQLPALEFGSETQMGLTKKEKEILELPLELCKKIQNVASTFDKYYRIFGQWLKAFEANLRIEKFLWETEIGMEDPALTGISVGLMWSIKGMLLTFLTERYFQPKNREIRINVMANFKQESLYTNLFCIFKFQPGYIIFTRVKYFFQSIIH